MKNKCSYDNFHTSTLIIQIFDRPERVKNFDEETIKIMRAECSELSRDELDMFS